ncbi:protein of unknown function [Arachidicoccus rhizosphaerae]|jgi:hypothetical protein|uniref:Nucleotide modification associated domain-containing protein n=1 Tax=Arachidicoccus rhizosphaerae TaxID=551991 RepID=A0A1H3VNW0_9BACT|nr:DUF1599 domain-containing protein [Arachidicoccus rhizosphaerae]SDZ75782.1 protein of unknown function [Arachidicoccus rhizosphaerae]
MSATLQQYDQAVNVSKEIFIKKAKDYGTSWRVLRTISVIDQIYIKALRIRNLQELKEQKVADDIPSEFIGILNYAVIGLIQLKKEHATIDELSVPEVTELYDQTVTAVKQTMIAKNHDYGEAWRNMSQQSLVDLILVKLLRMKQILENDGKTLISEGLDANYTDILNYAVFALILMDEQKA